MFTTPQFESSPQAEMFETIRKVIREELQQFKNDHLNPKEDEYGLLTLRETSKLLRKSRPTIYSFIKRGILQAHRLPGTRGLFFRRDELGSAFKKVEINYHHLEKKQNEKI